MREALRIAGRPAGERTVGPLSWDETVSLYLRYVDNWSLGRDMDVMVRTVPAVVAGRGAY